MLLLAVTALGWWRFGTRIVPSGQRPLVTLDGAAMAGFREDFNKASGEVRIIALLSPT